MLKKIFLIAASAVAGIYVTSEEGKNVRKALYKKKLTIDPVIKELLEHANDVLSGAKELNSDEVKANVELLLDEARETLIQLNLDKTTETIKDAIRVASRQIRDASNEVEKEKRKKTSVSKTGTLKVPKPTKSTGKTGTLKVPKSTKNTEENGTLKIPRMSNTGTFKSPKTKKVPKTKTK